MKKITAIPAILALLFTVTTGGETLAQAKALKLGVVNMQVILNESEAGIAAVKKLKTLAEKETRVMQQKQKAVKKMESEFEQQRLISRPDVLEQKEQEILRARREFELYREDTRRSVQRSQARETQRVVVEVRKIIAGYGKTNNYTLIFEKNDGTSPVGSAVLYVDGSIDVTADIVKIYNEQHRRASVGPRR